MLLGWYYGPTWQYKVNSPSKWKGPLTPDVRPKLNSIKNIITFNQLVTELGTLLQCDNDWNNFARHTIYPCSIYTEIIVGKTLSNFMFSSELHSNATGQYGDCKNYSRFVIRMETRQGWVGARYDWGRGWVRDQEVELGTMSGWFRDHEV